MVTVFTFRLFRIPVKVQWSFLLIAALLGFVGRQDPTRVIAWVAIVFFSILIHELGHAFTARSMGAAVAIELNGLGGLTRWSVPPTAFGPGRRALVAASGSAVGVAFGGLVWLVASQFGPYSGLTSFVLNTLIFVNLFWGLLNWLPIRPLDGGHLLLSLLEKTAPNRADAIARVVFSLTSAAALAFAIWADLIFIAVLAGWMLMMEFSAGRPRQPASTSVPEFSYDDQADEFVEPSPPEVRLGDLPPVAEPELIDVEGEEVQE